MTNDMITIFIIIFTATILFNVIAMIVISNKITERCDKFGYNLQFMNDKIDNIIKGGENNERKKKV